MEEEEYVYEAAEDIPGFLRAGDRWHSLERLPGGRQGVLGDPNLTEFFVVTVDHPLLAGKLFRVPVS